MWKTEQFCGKKLAPEIVKRAGLALFSSTIFVTLWNSCCGAVELKQETALSLIMENLWKVSASGYEQLGVT